jgi:hypothetical protein
VTSLNGLTGALTLTPGSGISITPSGSSISIAYTGGGGAGGITSVTHDASLAGAGTGASPLAIANGQVVRSVNGLHDAVTLAPGSNVTITPSGSTLTIASSGGGGLTLPFSASIDDAHPGFEIDNAGSAGIVGKTTGTGAGISGTGHWGVYGQGNASQTTGVYGLSGNPSLETGWAGVWGDSHDFTAVQGTSFKDRGVLGITNSASAVAAVEGLNKASGGVGVLGRTGGGSGLLSSASAGVWGDSPDPNGAGVFGSSPSVGVSGYSGSVGVFGHANIGVHGNANGTADSVGILFTGGLAGTGTKSFIEPHPTDAGKQIRYVCLEGRESGTYFRGTGRIVGGFATIEVPEDFRLVSRPDGLTVQLTPVGDLAVLAVMSQSLDRIVVRGSGDVEFHYMVNGVRRNVPALEPIQENRFFVPRTPDDPALTTYSDRETRALLVRNGVLNSDGTINPETAHRLGWDQQESWKGAEAEASR